jgi:ribosomal protein L37AE/L43A
LMSPHTCPVCQRPLAFDERFKRWFCHHCKKKYETHMEWKR